MSSILKMAQRHLARQGPSDYSHISGSAEELSASIQQFQTNPHLALMPYKMFISNRLGLWAELKSIYRGYTGDVCQVCRKRRMDTLHHKSYANPGREDVWGQLIPICTACHMAEHKDKIAARQQSLTEATWKKMENL